jgi:hypothetical protein
MNLPLSTNENNFPAQATKVQECLDILENKIKGRSSDTVSLIDETLTREVRWIMPEICRLRLDCLCFSLTNTYYDPSIELFQILKQLNLLVDLLQYFMNEKTGSTTPDLPPMAEDMSALLKAIVKTRRKLTRIAYSPKL